MTPPHIEFLPVRSWLAFYEARSSNQAIRFRVMERRKFTLIDADWYSTRWELAPSARGAIFAFCEGRASKWGGGVACLIVQARPDSAAELRCFLERMLSDPTSWLQWDRGSLHFVPLPVLEAAA